MKKTFIVLSFMFISTILFATPIDDLYSSLLFNEDTLWISEQSLRIIKSSDKNTIKEYYPDIETLNYYDDAEGRVIQWDESECFTSFTIFPHLYRDKDVISITYGQITGLLSFYFSYKSMSENYYYIDTTMTFNCKQIVNQNAFSKCPIHEDECIMILQFDGDYLNVYLNDLKGYYGTFCKIDKKTLDEYNSLISTGKSKLSRVTWPRHTDGTCDYEDVSSVKTVSTSTTNVTPNKTMTVSENLKLRSAEATTSEILTVMSAGTKVKITGTNTYIDVEIDGRTARIAGEMIVGGFVCYKSSMKNWLVPENELLTEEDKKEIIQKVTEKTAGSHMVITFE